MKKVKLIFSLGFVALFTTFISSCNLDKPNDSELGVVKLPTFNSVYTSGETFSKEGLFVYDKTTKEEIKDYELSIKEGEILNEVDEKLEITVYKENYLSTSFNIAVNSKDSDLNGKLEIYLVNDFHGAFKETEEVIGLSKLGQYLIDAKNENPYTLILSGGDMFQGGIESNRTKGKIVVGAMNYIGFDAMTIGNHEFDWGDDAIVSFSNLMKFPFLGSNVYYSATNLRPDYLKETIVINRGDLKIGIIGTVSEDLASDITASIAKNYNFTSPYQRINELSLTLRNEGCDLVFLLTHDSGFYDYGIDSEPKFTINAQSGVYVDAMFFSHDHIPKSGSLNNVPYLEGVSNGKGFGYMSFNFTKTNNEYSFSKLDNHYTYASTLENIKSNDLIDNLLNVYSEEIGDINGVICSFTGSVSRYEFVEIACKAMLSYIKNFNLYEKEISTAFQNYGGVRSDFSGGDFTYSDLVKIFPFDNTLVIIEGVTSDFYDELKGEYNYVEEEYPTFTNGVTSVATINYISEQYPSYNVVYTGISIQDFIETYLRENY